MPLDLLVGERGFEPPTPWSRTRCSTRLSHSPNLGCRSVSLGRGLAHLPLDCALTSVAESRLTRGHALMLSGSASKALKRNQNNYPQPG